MATFAQKPKKELFLFLPKKSKTKNALFILFRLISKLHRFEITVPPAFCTVKAKANKNWQSQHLNTLEDFVSETSCKRIALVSLQTALA